MTYILLEKWSIQHSQLFTALQWHSAKNDSDYAKVKSFCLVGQK